MLKWHSRALADVLQQTSVPQGPTEGRAGGKAAAGQSGLGAKIHPQLWLQALGCASSGVPQSSPLRSAPVTSDRADVRQEPRLTHP